MTTIEERAKRICTNTFCNKSHKPICKTCIWRFNTERAEPQCSVSEYKELIKSIYDSAVSQLILQREELTREDNLKGKNHIEIENRNIHFDNECANPIHTGFCPVSEPLSEIRNKWRLSMSKTKSL